MIRTESGWYEKEGVTRTDAAYPDMHTLHASRRLNTVFFSREWFIAFYFLGQSKAFLAIRSNSGQRIEYVSMKKTENQTTISILHG